MLTLASIRLNDLTTYEPDSGYLEILFYWRRWGHKIFENRHINAVLVKLGKKNEFQILIVYFYRKKKVSTRR